MRGINASLVLEASPSTQGSSTNLSQVIRFRTSRTRVGLISILVRAVWICNDDKISRTLLANGKLGWFSQSNFDGEGKLAIGRPECFAVIGAYIGHSFWKIPAASRAVCVHLR